MSAPGLTVDPARGRFGHSVRRTLMRVLALPRAAWLAAGRAWRLRQAAHALHALDDWQLSDLGVARAEIETVVRHGHHRDNPHSPLHSSAESEI